MAVKVISEDKSSQNCLQNIINVIRSELFNTGVVWICTMYIVHVFGIIIALYVEVVSQLLISGKLLCGHQEYKTRIYRKEKGPSNYKLLYNIH